VACPNDPHVYEKEQEKILKYQDLKIEIEKMWNVRARVVPIVVGALGATTNRLQEWTGMVSEKKDTISLQKSALLGTARILRQVLQL